MADKRRVKHDYEIRIPQEETEVDEIVASDVKLFHMEYMDKSCVWFGVTFQDGETLSWLLNTKRAKITTNITERPDQETAISRLRRMPEKCTHKGYAFKADERRWKCSRCRKFIKTPRK